MFYVSKDDREGGEQACINDIVSVVASGGPYAGVKRLPGVRETLVPAIIALHETAKNFIIQRLPRVHLPR